MHTATVEHTHTHFKPKAYTPSDYARYPERDILVTNKIEKIVHV